MLLSKVSGMRNGGCAELVEASTQMVELKREIERVARSEAKVLITGESGVGKELVARAIHALSLRTNQIFIPVNCAGLPETLLESELFGHVKGSFTGAYRDKPGKLEMAQGGTIFLDEIGEMTSRMQGLLLRFLETGEVQKVGTDRPLGHHVRVRVITATNKHLPDLITNGLFREDLFYRLNVINLWVPPLRERREDIPVLVEGFLKNFQSNNGPVAHSVSEEALAALTAYPWPGNVRELQNVLERLLVTLSTEVIELHHLPPEIQAPRGAMLRPRMERRRTVADQLYTRLRDDRESFWTVVYPLYMRREITRSNVRDLVRKGLEEARGNYKIMVRLFNMESGDYKRFLNFLRKHECQLPFKEYR